ncbi:V-type proton ATPase subunit G 1-like [Tubulanus polymorphus]|uniref:V-type proton ATPase subunit G 1-like n=1 Tax=Tubulanus polymorphus TaxID=672921 RepID=UPI003DA4B53D
MASQSQGIQQLLAAEKRAAEKVAEARKRKARRLKQAKEEAQAEIEAYRQKREKEFRDKEEKTMGSKGNMQQTIDDAMARQLQDMNQNVASNKEKTVLRLIEIVADIEAKRHINLRI